MSMNFTGIISIIVFTRSSLSYAKQVDLKWRPVEGAKAYNLVVAKDQAFTKRVIEQRVETNSLDGELPPGSYYLKVQAINSFDSPGQWSVPFNLKVVEKKESSVSSSSSEPQSWFIAMGPVMNGTSLGNYGTRFHISIGSNMKLSEKWSGGLFYEGNHNTQSAGNAITLGGYRFLGFTRDRGSDISPVFLFDFGYGGGNRNIDPGLTVGMGFGVQFYRTTNQTFEVMYRRLTITTPSVTGLGSYPTLDTLRFAIYF